MHWSITLAIITIIFCFGLMAWSASMLITGASALARKSGISSLMIGLTIIAMGTSLPEIVIAFFAATHNTPNFALGSAIGSNIANIGFVLGSTAMFVPLRVRSKTVHREWPILFAVMVLLSLLMINGVLNRSSAIILLSTAVIVLLWLISQALRGRKYRDVIAAEFQEEIPAELSLRTIFLQIGFGLLFLLVSSRLIVESAIVIAQHFHVSNLIIGLTILALGTSLPEFATSVTGARKHQHDIVVGNILGSNIFNILLVISIPILMHPITLQHRIIWDMTAMFILCMTLCYFASRFSAGEELTRLKGGILVSMYIGYLVLLYYIH